jgi:hypothetical protein
MNTQSYKRIGMVLAVVASSAVTWKVAHVWLTGPDPFTDLTTMLWPAVAIMVQAAVVGLAWLLLEERVDRLAAILASWAAFILFWRPDVWYVSALVPFILFWYIGSRRIRHDIHERRTLRVWAGLDRGVRLVLLGVFLMISLGFYLLPTSAPSVDSISKGVQDSLHSSYSSSLVQSQLQGIPQSTGVKAQEQLASQVDHYVRTWVGPLAPYLPPLLAFVLFLSLWGVSFLFRESGLALAALLFLLLRKVGFLRIVQEDQPVDVIRL